MLGAPVHAPPPCVAALQQERRAKLLRASTGGRECADVCGVLRAAALAASDAAATIGTEHLKWQPPAQTKKRMHLQH